MIKTEDLLLGIDRKLNKLASNQHQYIPIEDKIAALNEAQINLVKQKVTPNNLFQVGFDSFALRYMDLQNLVVPEKKLQAKRFDSVNRSYYVNLKDLSENFLIPTYIICEASRDVCPRRIINVTNIVKHSDVSLLLNNSFFSPSFLFQETIGVISDDKLIVYANDKDGDFVINNIITSFLRLPNPIDYEGYIHLDGKPSTTINCELSSRLESELLNLAVKELSINIEDYNKAQAQDMLRN